MFMFIFRPFIELLVDIRALLVELVELAKEQVRLLRKIERDIHFSHPVHRTKGIVFITSEGVIMADIVLSVGQSTTVTIAPVEADGTTITPGAVVSAQTYSLSDPAVTTVQNPDGTLTITAVSATTTDLTNNSTATVTDQDGTVGNFSKSFTMQVTAPTGRTAGIIFQFSKPA
jgi:hypothetical protein